MSTTISYDKPVKDYIDELSATGHVTHRLYTKKSVTFHHNGGRLSHEGVLNVWKTRPASAQFDVDSVGAVCQYTKVNEYAWHAGSAKGNIESIGIEMANTSTAPKWEVAEVTWRSGARLAGWLFANVIKARPVQNENILRHKDWRATECAGPYIASVWNELCAEVVKWYEFFVANRLNPAPSRADDRPPIVTPKKTDAQVADEVIANKWGNGDDRKARLTKAGYNASTIQSLVNAKLSGKKPATPAPARPAPASARKSNAQIASEVWANKWGNGDDRSARLTKAGYNPTLIQQLVNRGVGAPQAATRRKSESVVADEVIAGKWGNGDDRKSRLSKAGYNPNNIQTLVNRRLG